MRILKTILNKDNPLIQQIITKYNLHNQNNFEKRKWRAQREYRNRSRQESTKPKIVVLEIKLIRVSNTRRKKEKQKKGTTMKMDSTSCQTGTTTIPMGTILTKMDTTSLVELMINLASTSQGQVMKSSIMQSTKNTMGKKMNTTWKTTSQSLMKVLKKRLRKCKKLQKPSGESRKRKKKSCRGMLTGLLPSHTILTPRLII